MQKHNRSQVYSRRFLTVTGEVISCGSTAFLFLQCCLVSYVLHLSFGWLMSFYLLTGSHQHHLSNRDLLYILLRY